MYPLFLLGLDLSLGCLGLIDADAFKRIGAFTTSNRSLIGSTRSQPMGLKMFLPFGGCI